MLLNILQCTGQSPNTEFSSPNVKHNLEIQTILCFRTPLTISLDIRYHRVATLNPVFVLMRSDSRRQKPKAII